MSTRANVTQTDKKVNTLINKLLFMQASYFSIIPNHKERWELKGGGERREKAE